VSAGKTLRNTDRFAKQTAFCETPFFAGWAAHSKRKPAAIAGHAARGGGNRVSGGYMARYTDSVCKLCRREGMKLFLKGERCMSPKCAFERRGYAPGMHGKQAQFRQRASDYGLQLREKQRARRIYGVFERQFRRYFDIALRGRGQTGSNLLAILESRFDNVIYRLGFAESRAQARQLIQHNHFELNGRRLNIPSALVAAGDVIVVREASKQNGYFQDLRTILEHRSVPEWLRLDSAEMSGTVLAIPSREQIDVPLSEQLIVEYYSR
jgi:small subunit ribosomal protein S4